MKLFIIKFEISKPYDQWEEAFLAHESRRSEHQITALFHGLEEASGKVVVGLRASSQDALDRLMDADADVIESTGHVLSSTTMEIVTI